MSKIDAMFQPWQKPHPRDSEIVLAVLTPEGEERMSTDDPVDFLNWVGDNYPIVLKSFRLELATYGLLEDN
jgi:hypothetical protein